MPIYSFDSDVQIPKAQELAKSIPPGLPAIPGIRQSSHVEGGVSQILGPDLMAIPYDLEEFIQPGFRALDNAMKHYWSGIRVPTKDAYRFMRVKVAGGDVSLLIWSDDLVGGRVRLPLAAISREGWKFNPERFSPAWHAMTARYVNTRGNLASKVYRPVPFMVEFNLTIWAEHKRDIEYIIYQVDTRFNPLAEFRMFDGKLEGNVQLHHNGTQDASDKEAGYDQHASVRYEVAMSAEAWLPLPEKVIPTILGRVTILKEQVGQILTTSLLK